LIAAWSLRLERGFERAASLGARRRGFVLLFHSKRLRITALRRESREWRTGVPTALRGGKVPVAWAHERWYAKSQRSKLERKPVRLGNEVFWGEEKVFTHREVHISIGSCFNRE